MKTMVVAAFFVAFAVAGAVRAEESPTRALETLQQVAALPALHRALPDLEAAPRLDPFARPRLMPDVRDAPEGSVAPLAPRSVPRLEGSASIAPPVGWLQFCRDTPGACAASGEARAVVTLDARLRGELQRINSLVNATVVPVSDLAQFGRAEHWTLPTSGRGDCEDYVLEKRRQLMARGWPSSALLITVVRDRRGDGHAVLIARTHEGDLVLDNTTSRILPFHATGYRYLMRQSDDHPNAWVMLAPRDAILAVASRR